MNRHKQYYDRKIKCMNLCPDDIVIVRVKVFGNDRKVADKLEQSPYLVVKQISDKPVFRIQPLNAVDDSKDRILHRNMLFPLWTKKHTGNVEPMDVLSKANQLMNLHSGL